MSSPQTEVYSGFLLALQGLGGAWHFRYDMRQECFGIGQDDPARAAGGRTSPIGVGREMVLSG